MTDAHGQSDPPTSFEMLESVLLLVTGAVLAAIRKYLEGHHGRPQLVQRQLDDLKHTPSLNT